MSEEHKFFLLKAPRQRLKSRINNNKMARFNQSAIHCSVEVTEVIHQVFTMLSLTEPKQKKLSYLQHQSSNTLPHAKDTTWVVCWDFFFPPGDVLQKQPGPFYIHTGFPSQKHSPPTGSLSLEAAKAPIQCIHHRKRSVSELRRFLLICWGLFVFAVFKIPQH